MEKNYLESKGDKKSKTKPYLWALLAAAAAFIFVMIKFANGGAAIGMGGLPSSDVAYEVAQDFVKANVRSNDVTFSSSGFQFAKKSDSVYVIRTEVESRDERGDEKQHTFKLIMRYKGGKADEMRAWDLETISEE